ncbi:VanZ family protein [Listeria kieliensis]|uniref:Transporter n=1 Tax=Listeria kieliensis TaxID=1621700 RepID=A0A3D8TWW6_9LIST|nr:VanZ family protein [Listeria kieliensis]RDX02704.1 transporter [Listeria kieliensis]
MKKILIFTVLPVTSVLLAVFLYFHFFEGWMYFYLNQLMRNYSFIDYITIAITAALVYLAAVQIMSLELNLKLLIISYLIYFGCLVFLLFAKDSHARGISFDTFSFIEPFLAGNLRVITIGNVIAFIPIGFLMWKLRSYQAFSLAVALIIAVETTQYYLAVGYFDTGDIFLNVCGIMTGYLMIRFANFIVSKKNANKSAS